MVTFLILLAILIVVAVIIGIIVLVLLAIGGVGLGTLLFIFGDLLIGVVLTVLLLKVIFHKRRR